MNKCFVVLSLRKKKKSNNETVCYLLDSRQSYENPETNAKYPPTPLPSVSWGCISWGCISWALPPHTPTIHGHVPVARSLSALEQSPDGAFTHPHARLTPNTSSSWYCGCPESYPVVRGVKKKWLKALSFHFDCSLWVYAPFQNNIPRSQALLVTY